MNITIGYDEGTPISVRRAVSAMPEVRTDASRAGRILIDDAEHPLVLLPRPQQGASETAAAAELAKRVPRGAVGLVVASAIPHRERDALEGAGLSWLDGRGAVHISWRGVLVHIDRTGRRPLRLAADHGADKLGPAGIRAVQVVLGSPKSDGWTISRLARQAGVSIGQAHNVLRILERDRLLETHGRGPKQQRFVTDRNAALDWLSGVDQSRRRPESVATHLYGRTLHEVLQRFADRARTQGLRYAATGAAAAQLLGTPVLSSLDVTQVRVGAVSAIEVLTSLELDDLTAEDGGRGSNLELWTDAGELGTYQAAEISGIHVAPALRVWLDLARQGGRHSDAAQLFREQAIERA